MGEDMTKAKENYRIKSKFSNHWGWYHRRSLRAAISAAQLGNSWNGRGASLVQHVPTMKTWLVDGDMVSRVVADYEL